MPGHTWNLVKEHPFVCRTLVLLASIVMTVSALGAAPVVNNPVPLIYQPLSPVAALPGGSAFTLTVNGANFVLGSVVDWNGAALATTFVNSDRLTAAVPASLIATDGTASVKVINPTPGGGASNRAFFQITTPTTSAIFSRSDIATGTLPISAAVGDFNGDGILDLAITNYSANTLTILLGNGDGTFTPATSAATGTNPTFAAIGDFNGDGKSDLAVTNEGDSTLTILLGNGNGTFTPVATTPATGSFPESIVVGDFNGDGFQDLAVANSGANHLNILLGNGDGTFTPTALSPTTDFSYSLAMGDFNRDGKLDLAVTGITTNDLTILLGDGTGNFTPTVQNPATGAGPNYVAAGDFNNDGKLDLAVANSVGNTLSILLGNGDGTFTSAAAAPATGASPFSVSIGDFNGDGKLDLAVANNGSNTVTILLGDNTGNFTPIAVSPATGNGPYLLAAGDFNGDGRLDLAVPNDGDSTVSILLQAPKASVSTSTLPFGAQLVGATTATQTVTLTNTGTGTLILNSVVLSGTNATDFTFTNVSCTHPTLPVGGSCTFNASFTPLAVGARTATITVTDNDSDIPNSTQTVTLTGTGTAPVAGVVPASLTFSNQLVGTASATQSTVLTNSGTAPLTITGIGVAGDYSQTNNCGSVVAASGGSCSITVTFTPTATGARAGAITITDNSNAVNGSKQTVALSGAGIAPVAAVVPASLTFSNQLVGTASATQSTVLTNSGTAPLAIISIVASGDYSQTNNCGSSVAASGGSCTITVTFTPTATGARAGAITITDNSNAVNGSKQTVGATGTGVAPIASLSSTTLSFGNQVPGSTSSPQTLTLGNTGTALLNITSLAASGDFSQTNNCGATIAVGANCTITVTFTPTATGSLSGTITIADDAVGSPQSIALSGTGATAAISLSPAALTFPGQVIKTASAPLILTLNNPGGATLNLANVVISGKNGGDFAQANTCGTSVAAGASCIISVTFAPTAVGPRAGTLTFTDNAANSPQTVALSGVGTDFTVAPAAANSDTATIASGDTANFDLTLTGTTGFNGTLTLACSGAPALATCSVAPASVPLLGTTPADITVNVATTPPSSLVGESLFRPTSFGMPPQVFVALPGAASMSLIALALALATFAGLGMSLRKRLVARAYLALRWRFAPAVLLVAVLAAVSMPGCGGGAGGGGIFKPGTPSGMYTLYVTSTFASGSTSTTHTIALSLTVK